MLIDSAPWGVVTSKVRHAPAAAPRKNRIFLRIVRRTFSLSVAAHHGTVFQRLALWLKPGQIHNTFPVSLRPFCQVDGFVPKPRLARVPSHQPNCGGTVRNGPSMPSFKAASIGQFGLLRISRPTAIKSACPSC